METRELRIGNWVNRQYFNPYPDNEHFTFDACRIERIAPDMANLLLKDNSIIGKYKLDRLSPITLTPEILEKAGFKSNCDSVSETMFMHNSIQNIEHNSDGFWYYVAHGNYLKIDSVHQLQNLYFALTGSELEINLTTVDTPAQLQ